MKSEQLIKELIKMGESEQLELQRAARKDVIARTVCSFLNGEGGQLLIGVSDAGNIIGVNHAQELSAELQRYLIQQIVPEAPVTVSIEPYEQKELLLIKVWSGSKKPYLFDGGIFYRRGVETVKASSKELSELIHARQQTEIHWERQPALGVELEDLDLEEINATIEASIKNSRAKEARRKFLEFLSYYGLFVNGHFTNAAVVLFVKNPARFLPQCRVRLSYLQRGKTSSTFKDDQLLEGNLFKNIEAIQDFFYKHLEMKRSFSDTEWQRKDDLQYPIAALREGVLNALVHRDYSNVSGSVSITIFPDELEITNFGNLALKPAELKKSHLSLPVNPDIAQVVFLRGYIEKIGRGTM
jgi:ATP-dependent DNA helicase RecG